MSPTSFELGGFILRETFAYTAYSSVSLRMNLRGNGSILILLASGQHNLYDIYHCCVYSENKTPYDGQRNCPKHVESEWG